MQQTISKIENKVIVSCQASSDEPIYKNNCLMSIVESVIQGGAGGLRLAGQHDISHAKNLTDIPIIGITKPDPLPHNWKEIVYITPTFKDIEQLAAVGADIIAFDGTSRIRPKENLEEIIYKAKKNLNRLLMADVSTLKEGLNCSKLGVDIISTTLSGYTSHTIEKNNGEPDFDLLQDLVKKTECPIILEGRVWTPEHVKKAFSIGAYAVVIGSAITRPKIITERFVKNSKEEE